MADKSLEVKITADVTSLQAQSAVAKAELSTLNSSVKSLANQFVAASDEMKASLAPELEKAAQQAAAAKAEVNKLNAEMRELRVPTEDVGGWFGNISKSATEASEKIETARARLAAITGLFSAAGEFAVAAFGIEQVAEAINRVAESGEQLEKLSEETGLTAQELSGLKVAAEETGTSFDSLATLLQRLPNTLQEAVDKPTSKAGEAFAAMGIKVSDAEGNIRPMGDVLDDVSAKLASYSDGANKTALETDIFGTKIGANLLPALNKLGQEGLPGAIDESNRLGLTWTGQTAAAATEFEEDLSRVKLGLEGITSSIIRDCLPALDALSKSFSLVTNTAPLDDQIAYVKSEINSATDRASVMRAGLEKTLANLEAEKAAFAAAAKSQSNIAGGAAPGSVQAPSANGSSGGSVSAHQGGGGTDAALNGPTEDDSGYVAQDTGKVASAKTAQDQLTQIASAGADTQIAVAQKQFDTYRDQLDAQVDAGKLSKAQELQDEIQAANQEYAAEEAATQKKIALYGSDTAAKAKALDDMTKLQADHDEQVAALDASLLKQQQADAQAALKAQQDAVAQATKTYENMFSPITNAFDKTITGVLQGTETLKTGMAHALGSIILSFIDSAAKMAASWAAHELAMLTVTQTTQAGILASQQAGKAAKAAMDSSSITGDAGRAFAGAYAAVAGIPYVGPILAPAAGAAAYAAVMAYDVASAEGGYAIPKGVNPLTQLHENEMVLPAHIAKPLQNMIAGNNTTNNTASSSNSFSFSQTVHGAGGDMAAIMAKAGKGMLDQMVDLNRNGTLRLPGR